MAAKETCSSPGFFGKPATVAASGDEEPARSGAGVSIEPYMQYLQQENNYNKGGMVNMMSSQPPPPVAMSLRARETSAMALKHIFDQISNSGNSGSSLAAATTTSMRAAGGEDQKLSHAQQMGASGFQGMRNHSLPDLRKRPPELDLNFRKAQVSHENSPAMAGHVGFGSPISTPTATNPAPLPSSFAWSTPMNSQLQQSFLPQAAASARPNPSSRQSTAQLTIFYSGNVNVYDDVPADKAHAIMLLAGNSWSSNFRSPAPPVQKERAPSPVRAGSPLTTPLSPNITVANNMASSASRGFSSPVPSPSLATPPPSPSLTQAPLEGKAQGAAKRPHAAIELPHARKASLQRFLEKRKDRVQVQPEVIVEEKGAAGQPASSRPSSPTSSYYSSKKECTAARSRSPSPSKSSKAYNNNNNNIEQNNPYQ